MPFNYNSIIIALTLIVLLFASVSTQQQPSPSPTVKQQPSAQSQPQQLLYTQNIQEFKSKKYNQRLQVVVGCWLLSKEYLDLYKSDYLFFKDVKLKQIVVLKLVKECMKKVSRKDAVLKITELVGKNVQTPKKYEELIPKQAIDSIFIEVSKLAVASYHQYEPINDQIVTNGQHQTFDSSLNHTDSNQQGEQNVNQSQTGTDAVANSKNQQQVQTPEHNQTTQQEILPQDQSSSSFKNLSEFDIFIIDMIKKYNQQFHKLISSKEGLRGKVEQQLKKREKYYFGFIPASSFSHSVFLVTISLSMVFCCTCYKYYKMRSNQKADERKKMAEDDEEECHAHSRIKQAGRVAKMTQLTMKKKR